MRHSLFSLLFIALIIGGCTTNDDGNGPVQPVGQLNLSVEAQPPTIRADGISRLVIFVEMRQGEQAVNDSTQIILLNSIGTLQQGIIYTSGGVALDTLKSDTTAGSGWIIAYSQGLRDSVEIMFTALD
ncbi:hypothetical protein EHM69_02575 [candidate division KSB1 bacterium]|nr:MAG: hypothetical protein EHM69_02575 [candidate division KSB1 bacterium]